jgi:hypothetical protein
MLLRILTDNPGKTFTRNMDTKFVQTVKELLRFGMDLNVKQLLIETLQSFSREKTEDETLAPLLEMWKKYQEKMIKAVASNPRSINDGRIDIDDLQGPVAPRTLNAPPFNPDSQNYFGRNHHTRRLPPPAELSSRIEEARTSAKLLSQVVQSTPPSEILSHELIREFADRCQSASRSVQAYMVSENPAPDNDTMETLIETNEQLSNAMNQHQRAVLQARKILGLGYKDRNSATPPSRTDSGFAAPPPGPPPGRTDSGFAAPPPGPPPNQAAKPQQPARRSAPPIPPPGDIAPIDDDEDDSPNPFSDPKTTTRSPPFLSDAPSNAPGQFNDTLGVEPYHPGFRESKSYVGRQDSAVGNVTMHAAVPEEDSDDERNYRGPTPTPAQPKQPVYRY